MVTKTSCRLGKSVSHGGYARTTSNQQRLNSLHHMIVFLRMHCNRRRRVSRYHLRTRRATCASRPTLRVARYVETGADLRGSPSPCIEAKRIKRTRALHSEIAPVVANLQWLCLRGIRASCFVCIYETVGRCIDRCLVWQDGDKDDRFPTPLASVPCIFRFFFPSPRAALQPVTTSTNSTTQRRRSSLVERPQLR